MSAIFIDCSCILVLFTLSRCVILGHTCSAVTKLTSYFQPLLMKMDCAREIPQQIMDVAEVSAGAALRSSVTNFHHQSHVLLVVLDGLFK